MAAPAATAAGTVPSSSFIYTPRQRGFGKKSDLDGSLDGGSMPLTVPELQAALKAERDARKAAEERVAELTGDGGGGGSGSKLGDEEMEGMRKEILRLQKQLAAAPKSKACIVM